MPEGIDHGDPHPDAHRDGFLPGLAHEELLDAHHHVDEHTVEAVVRAQMSRAMGGRRGMVEAAVPTISFTFTYILSKNVGLAIGISVGLAVAMLVLRLVQRSTVQYVLNALFGIGIGVFFVWLGGRNGGDASQKALAYFLPGLIYNAGYAVAMVLSILVRWPVVGLMVGAVSDDPVEWRRNPQIVRLCSHLTWLLVVPCILRVVVQVPIYLSGKAADDADPYVTALGFTKVAMGWPLQVAALAGMVWVLTRDKRRPGAGTGPGVEAGTPEPA